MKKAIYGIIILSLIVTASCKKTSTNPNSGTSGSWTFEGNTYSQVTCFSSVTTNANLEASSLATNGSNSTTFSSITVTFAGTSLPVSSGTYTVVNPSNFTTGNQVSISFGTASGNLYTSTGFGSNPKVNITVASNGKVSASGSGINLQNLNNASDSSSVTLSITQQ